MSLADTYVTQTGTHCRACYRQGAMEEITLCSLHAAAGEMREKIQEALQWLSHGVASENKSRAVTILESGLAHAEGR